MSPLTRTLPGPARGPVAEWISHSHGPGVWPRRAPLERALTVPVCLVEMQGTCRVGPGTGRATNRSMKRKFAILDQIAAIESSLQYNRAEKDAAIAQLRQMLAMLDDIERLRRGERSGEPS